MSIVEIPLEKMGALKGITLHLFTLFSVHVSNINNYLPVCNKERISIRISVSSTSWVCRSLFSLPTPCRPTVLPPAPALSSGTASAGPCWRALVRGRTGTGGRISSGPSCSCARWCPAPCPSRQNWGTRDLPQHCRVKPGEGTGQIVEKATFAALLFSCGGVCREN